MIITGNRQLHDSQLLFHKFTFCRLAHLAADSHTSAAQPARCFRSGFKTWWKSVTSSFQGSDHAARAIG